jgi:AraC-like DNA-binding protein
MGQITKAIHIQSTGKIGIFAVRFRPQGFSAIFEEKSDVLKEKTLLLEDIFCTQGKEIEERILNSTSSTERVAIIEQFLLQRLRRSRVFDQNARMASHLLSEQPNEECILQLARELKISLRQLERQFKTQVGMSPSQFIKIARFQKVLRCKLVNPAVSFATLAMECGYYDQSHFSRDFKDLSGLSPGAYFGEEHSMADHFSL